MALLNIDKNTLKLTVKVGVLEEYTPDQEIKEIYEEAQGLKSKLESNLKRIVGKVKNQAEAIEILKQDEEKAKKWKSYLEKTYAKQYIKLHNRVTNKNKEICSNFAVFLEKANNLAKEGNG